MQSIHIPTEHHPLFQQLWNTYDASFPITEKRTLAGQRAAFAHPAYHLEAFTIGGNFAGFIGWWRHEAFRFAEHVAISPAMRGQGIGGRMLTTWLQAEAAPALLEADDTGESIAHRRLEFYKRLGFKENIMRHSHPSYRDGTGTVPLHMLSWPDSISQGTYTVFACFLQMEVLASTGTAYI